MFKIIRVQKSEKIEALTPSKDATARQIYFIEMSRNSPNRLGEAIHETY